MQFSSLQCSGPSSPSSGSISLSESAPKTRSLSSPCSGHFVNASPNFGVERNSRSVINMLTITGIRVIFISVLGGLSCYLLSCYYSLYPLFLLLLLLLLLAPLSGALVVSQFQDPAIPSRPIPSHPTFRFECSKLLPTVIEGPNQIWQSVEVSGDSVEVSGESLELSRGSVESVDFSKQSLEVSRELVDVSRESEEVSRESVEVSKESVDVSTELVEVSTESVEVRRASIEVIREAAEVNRESVDISK